MSRGAEIKKWLSPFTAVAFVAVALTGILMFFHFRLLAIHGVHEVMGLLFAFAGTLHLILNWRVFVNYFRAKLAVASVVAGVVLCLLLLLAGTLHEGHERGGPERQDHGGE
jgi:hypothetical protein